ncbi:hypothetical protein [uncultured Chloroflexus sp.]|uniref:hypothetical protein n=1 Tax=uncultured Chloroflexus sp. TaxID=214040 RepID=UPI002627CDE2|nr:hypothetical protein [uncultured Chloroflexus sp.]
MLPLPGIPHRNGQPSTNCARYAILKRLWSAAARDRAASRAGVLLSPTHRLTIRPGVGSRFGQQWRERRL